MKNFTFLTIFFLSQIAILKAQDSVEPMILTEETVILEVAEEVDTVMVEPSIQFGGSIDAYYRGNFNNDFDAAPGTSFANLPGFALGMANLTISKDGAKAGFMADLVFGPRGEDATFASGTLRPTRDGSTNSSGIVNQLYAYWNVSDKFKVTIGNFNTFLGYEVISPTANFNYSTSYMFSYGPFSHTGLKFDADLGNGFSLMAGVFNPTDFTEYNLLNDYVGGLQLGYDFGSGSVFLNGLFQDGFYQIDITGGVDLSDAVYLGLNATVAQDNFGGVALYLQGQVMEDLKLGIRGEYFADNGIGVIGTDENVIDLTFSANYTVGNLTFIPEIRIDVASTEVFQDDQEFNKSLASFVLAAVYGF